MLTLLLLKLFYFYINFFNNKTPSPDSPTNTQNAENSGFNNQEDLIRFQFDKERLLITVLLKHLYLSNRNINSVNATVNHIKGITIKMADIACEQLLVFN